MKKILIAFLGVFILLAVTIVWAQTVRRNRLPANLLENNIRVGELDRRFYVYVPKSLPVKKKVPLVFVFHGGGGTPFGVHRRMGFSQLAEREKFIAVYPEGIGRNFNDGRKTDKTRAHRENIDDIAFVSKILDNLQKDYKIDKKRIFSTGISNGGIFSHYVGGKLSERFAAIAPVVGGLAVPFNKDFNPKKPVSVFIIQGTDDRLVPYDGGMIGRNRGRIVSTDEAIRLWAGVNKTKKEPVKGKLPDKNRRDGCRVETYLWTGGKNKTEIKLYKLIGGGHTWPGGRSVLPRFIVGTVCRDFNATNAIWKFFKKHSK